MLNLDTHILLFALTGELRGEERRLLERHRWGISAIVVWEVFQLARLGRIDVDLRDRELLRTLRRLHTWPLTLEVCRAIDSLDVASDPADEIIAATSLVHEVPLLTRDARLRPSRVVPLALA